MIKDKLLRNATWKEGQGIVQFFLNSLPQRGGVETLKIAYYEGLYGLRFGFATARSLSTQDLLGDSATGLEKGYSPTKFYNLNRCFRHLHHLKNGGRIIDIGCGSGRVLLYAAEFGVPYVAGIEISQVLVDQANDNMARRFGNRKRRPTWKIWQGDALQPFDLDEYDAIFMYNPFNRPLVAMFVERIAKSHAAKPRDLRVVYVNPLYGDLFEAHSSYVTSVRDDSFAIYSLVASEVVDPTNTNPQ